MSKKKQPKKLSPGAEKLRQYLLEIYSPIVWPAGQPDRLRPEEQNGEGGGKWGVDL
jgi:hypothetical protein